MSLLHLKWYMKENVTPHTQVFPQKSLGLRPRDIPWKSHAITRLGGSGITICPHDVCHIQCRSPLLLVFNCQRVLNSTSCSFCIDFQSDICWHNLISEALTWAHAIIVSFPIAQHFVHISFISHISIELDTFSHSSKSKQMKMHNKIGVFPPPHSNF